MFCRDCGQPMHVYQQERRTGASDTIAECVNRDCDLHMVTLDARTWATITDAQLEGYRNMVKKLRAGAA